MYASVVSAHMLLHDDSFRKTHMVQAMLRVDREELQEYESTCNIRVQYADNLLAVLVDISHWKSKQAYNKCWQSEPSNLHEIQH